MITRRITLILGAGANKPFGFPTGFELSREIINNCSSTGKSHYNLNRGTQPSAMEHLLMSGHAKHEIVQFATEFQNSGTNSIDEFLRDREEFLVLGKKAIAISLLPYENNNIVEFDTSNWYRFIWSKMKSQRLSDNNLKFITYNYDRSLKQFLHNSLQSSYGKSLGDNTASKQIEEYDIVHLHGSLGLLPFESGRDNLKIEYGVTITPEILISSASQINILHEEESKASYKKAHAILSESDNIYFLGFGFHSLNVQRLLETEFKRAVEIRFTSYGMTEPDVRNAMNPFIKRELNIKRPNESSETTIDFLRKLHTLD